MSQLVRSSLLSIASLALLACAPAGSAPRVVDVVATPTTVPVGTASSIDITLSFEDDDGDVDRIEGTVTGSGVAPVTLAPVPIEASGMTSSTGHMQLMLTLPIAGPYEVALQVRDAAGHLSNDGIVMIEAVAP